MFVFYKCLCLSNIWACMNMYSQYSFLESLFSLLVEDMAVNGTKWKTGEHTKNKSMGDI